MIAAIDIQSVLEDLEISTIGGNPVWQFNFPRGNQAIIDNDSHGCTLSLWSGNGCPGDYAATIPIKSAQRLKDILELIALD